MSTLSIWTGNDTSEAGPSIDAQPVSVLVEGGEDGETVVHLTTSREELWTVALTLSDHEALMLASKITKFRRAERIRLGQCVVENGRCITHNVEDNVGHAYEKGGLDTLD